MVEDIGRSYDTVLKNLRHEFTHGADIRYNPFYSMDSEKRWRDDIDAFRAAESLLNKYIWFDKYIKVWWKNYVSDEIVQEYKTLKKDLSKQKERTLKNTRHYAWTSAKDHINRLASRINDAENKVMLKRREVTERQKVQNNIDKSQGESGKTYLKRVQLWGTRWEWMQFTSESNSTNIVTAMKSFFDRNPREQYEIDYTYCKNQRIKQSVYNKIGSYKAIIQYDARTKTVPLKDWKWTICFQNAPIYDGVVIETMKHKQIVKQQNDNEERDKEIDYNKKLDEDALKAIELESSVPEKLWKKLNEQKLLRTFLVKCESRLDELVKRMKWQGADLDRNEPISRKIIGSWLMEAHFKNPSSDRVVFAWVETKNDKSANKLPSNLYNLLRDHQSELKIYLTERIKSKWWELDEYAMRNRSVGALDVRQSIDAKEERYQDWQLYAINSFVEILDNLGKKWFNAELKKLQDHCKDMQFSLKKYADPKNGRQWVRWSDREGQVLELKKLFKSYKSNDWKWASMTDADAAKYIFTIFNKETSINDIKINMRKLFQWLTISDNASTSSITENIASDLLEDSESIELWQSENKSEVVKNCETTLKKINEYYWITFNEWWEILPQSAKANIDELYKALGTTVTSPELLYRFLKRKGVIQKGVFDYESNEAYWVWHNIDEWFPRWNVLNPAVKQWFLNMYKSLLKKQIEASRFSLTGGKVREMLEKENNQFSEKWYLTEEEKTRVQINNALMEDREALENFARWQTEFTKSAIKYTWINSMMHKSISESIVKRAWWFAESGKMEELKKIYNDAKWLWWWPFNFSDEFNQALDDHSLEIVIDILVTAVVSWLTVGWGFAYLAELLGKLWKRAESLLNFCKYWAKTIISRLRNTSSYAKIRNILNVKEVGKAVWQQILTNLFKMKSLNPKDNWQAYLSSWLLAQFSQWAWLAWQAIKQTELFNKVFSNSTINTILKNSKDLFGWFINSLGWSWGGVNWGPLLAVIVTMWRMSNSKVLKSVVKKTTAKLSNVTITKIFENSDWSSFSRMVLKLWPSTSLTIDGSWEIVASNSSDIPVWTNVLDGDASDSYNYIASNWESSWSAYGIWSSGWVTVGEGTESGETARTKGRAKRRKRRRH